MCHRDVPRQGRHTWTPHGRGAIPPMPWGRGRRGQVSLQSPCLNSINSPVPVLWFQTQVPTQKTHVPARQEGQDLSQAWRGKQLLQPSLPYLVHRFAEAEARCWPASSPSNWGSDREFSVKRPLVLLKSSLLALQRHCAI